MQIILSDILIRYCYSGENELHHPAAENVNEILGGITETYQDCRNLV